MIFVVINGYKYLYAGLEKMQMKKLMLEIMLFFLSPIVTIYKYELIVITEKFIKRL